VAWSPWFVFMAERISRAAPCAKGKTIEAKPATKAAASMARMTIASRSETPAGCHE